MYNRLKTSFASPAPPTSPYWPSNTACYNLTTRNERTFTAAGILIISTCHRFSMVAIGSSPTIHDSALDYFFRPSGHYGHVCRLPQD